MQVVDPGPNEAPITELYAFLSVDENGNEGIVASSLGTIWSPLVTSKRRILDLMIPSAKELAKLTGNRIVLVRLARQETIETFEP